MTHREREEQWRRFHAWEAQRLRSDPPDLASALAWVWDAWQLAAESDPYWGSRESAEEHWRHLAAVRAALASERLRDREDAEGVILRQGPRLDRVYLDAGVRALAAGLERPEIESFYRASLAQAGLPLS